MKGTLTPKTLGRIKNQTGHRPIADWAEFVGQCVVAGERISPFHFQADICRKIVTGEMRSGLVIKSRQLGLTLTTALTMAYLGQLRPGIQLSAVSKSQDDSSTIGKRIRKSAGHLLHTLSDNILELALTNGSLIKYLSAQSDNIGRGNANVEGLFLDEVGFYPYRDLLAALAPGTLWSKQPWQLCVTTPSDVESQFYAALTEQLTRPYDEVTGLILSGELPPYHVEIGRSVEGRDPTHIAFIHYRAVPRFAEDPKLYLGILLDAGLSPADVEREANLQFSSHSTDLIFAPTTVRALCRGVTQSRPTGFVTVGIDPSGYGRDRFAAVVMRVSSHGGIVQVIAEKSWSNYDGSQILADLEVMLTDCTGGDIFIESNGVGTGFVNLIENDPRFNRFNISGFTTNKNNKARSIAFIEWLLGSNRINFFVAGLPSQLSKFVMDKSGKNSRGGDDYVLALCHALQAIGGSDGSQFASWYKRFWSAVN